MSISACDTKPLTLPFGDAVCRAGLSAEPLVEEDVQPVFAGGDDIDESVAREIRRVEVNAGSRPRGTEIDYLLREGLAVPLEVVNSHVVPGARSCDLRRR